MEGHFDLRDMLSMEFIKAGFHVKDLSPEDELGYRAAIDIMRAGDDSKKSLAIQRRRTHLSRLKKKGE